MSAPDQTLARARSGGLSLAALAPWLIAAVFLAAMPFIFRDNSAITIMNQMAITIVFALAYNMLLGQGGMLSFGHAVYMGMGGFMSVHLMNYIEDGAISMPLPLLPLFGGLFGLGFAMISLGIGELIAACSVIIVVFFGGEEGVSGDRTYGIPVFGYRFLQQIEVYYLIAFWLMLSAALMYLLSRTPVRRMANAVRDNPERAEFVGYSQRWVRYYSFCASGFFAGIAGALFAINYEIMTEENLNLISSGQILLVTFLGGVGFFFGPIIGAVVFTLLATVLKLHTELWQLYVGALFVLTVMFFPGGLAGLLAMHVAPWRLGRMGVLAKPYVVTLIPGAVGILGLAAATEMLFHARHASVGGDEMGLFGMTVSSHSPLAWAVALAATAGGFWLARRGAPGLKAAWDEANTAPGARA